MDKSVKKISRLSIAAITCIFIGVAFAFEVISLQKGYEDHNISSTSRIVGLCFFAIAIIIGIVSLVVIKTNDNVRGTGFAITAIVLGFFLLVPLYISFSIANGINKIRLYNSENREHLQVLREAVIQYTKDHNGYLPQADQWCDLLMKHNKNISRETFNISSLPKSPCDFAFNNTVSNQQLSGISGDTVLLFGNAGSWNQSGGPKLVLNSKNKRFFSPILFVGGRIDFMPFESLDELHWINGSGKVDDLVTTGSIRNK